MDETTQVIMFLLGALKQKDATIQKLSEQLAAAQSKPTPDQPKAA